jgi:hypothetical protein
MIVKIKTINYDGPKSHPFTDPFTQARSEQAVEITRRDNKRAKALLYGLYNKPHPDSFNGRLNRVAEFEDYLGALRVEYIRKLNFIELLDTIESL